MDWFDLDWHRMFVPSMPILETVIRGSAMYLAMFGLLRVFRRQTGSIGVADLLVLLLIADAAQNGMAEGYKSITEGIVLVATIIGWEYLIDWMAFSNSRVAKVVERAPLLMIRDGQVMEDHLRQELMTMDDLTSQLRQKGVDDPARVARCFLEGDGHVSVVLKDPAENRSAQVSTNEASVR